MGKSTVRREVLRRTGAAYSVSATTRRPRPGEHDGVDYRFVDRGTFQEMIDRGELLEFAEVYGQLYGTPAGPVTQALRQGRTILLDIDVQGALQVAGKMPNATFILMVPPDLEALAERLGARGTEDPHAASRRLAKAREEMDAARQSGVYNHVVVNDDLESAVRQVAAIVNEERCRK